MSLASVIEKISSFLKWWIGKKKSGKVTIEINTSQGGIGDIEISTKEKFKW